MAEVEEVLDDVLNDGSFAGSAYGEVADADDRDVEFVYVLAEVESLCASACFEFVE